MNNKDINIDTYDIDDNTLMIETNTLNYYDLQEQYDLLSLTFENTKKNHIDEMEKLKDSNKNLREMNYKLQKKYYILYNEFKNTTISNLNEINKLKEESKKLKEELEEEKNKNLILKKMNYKIEDKLKYLEKHNILKNNSILKLKKENEKQNQTNLNVNYTVKQMEKEYTELINIIYEYQKKLHKEEFININ